MMDRARWHVVEAVVIAVVLLGALLVSNPHVRCSTFGGDWTKVDGFTAGPYGDRWECVW